MTEGDESFEKLQADLSELIDQELEDNSAIIGVNVGTHGGTLMAHKFKKVPKLTEIEIASAASSLLFLSTQMIAGALNQEVSHNIIAGKTTYLLSVLTDSITMIILLNREIAELEGMTQNVETLKNFALKISAIVETSDFIKEEIFVALKRAIPNALVLAIITKEGLPIKIQSTMPEPMLSAMVSAIYSLSTVLIEEGLEFSIIAGIQGSIILHELEGNRILCIAVPEADEKKIGKYIVKIKKIIGK